MNRTSVLTATGLAVAGALFCLVLTGFKQEVIPTPSRSPAMAAPSTSSELPALADVTFDVCGQKLSQEQRLAVIGRLLERDSSNPVSDQASELSRFTLPLTDLGAPDVARVHLRATPVVQAAMIPEPAPAMVLMAVGFAATFKRSRRTK